MIRKNSGVSLIELLITIGIVAVLGAATIFILKPAFQFSQTRDKERWSHMQSILTAVKQRLTDVQGKFETGCASGPLPAATTTIGSGTGNYNIGLCLAPSYITDIPFDPSTGSVASSGYRISYVSTTRSTTLSAPGMETTTTKSITR